MTAEDRKSSHAGEETRAKQCRRSNATGETPPLAVRRWQSNFGNEAETPAKGRKVKAKGRLSVYAAGGGVGRRGEPTLGGRRPNLLSKAGR